MVSNGNIISDDKEQANTFMDFFGKAVDNLEIIENRYLLNRDYQDQGEIENIISKFKYHPSILKIKNKVNITDLFKFNEVNEEQVLYQLNKINGKKSTTFQNIPCKSLKENSKVCAPVLTNIINNGIKNNTFPNRLKNADIIPIFKKDKKKRKDPTDAKKIQTGKCPSIYF